MQVNEKELCPFCGAYSPRSCELLEESGGECPWDLSGDYEGAPEAEDDAND